MQWKRVKKQDREVWREVETRKKLSNIKQHSYSVYIKDLFTYCHEYKEELKIIKRMSVTVA